MLPIWPNSNVFPTRWLAITKLERTLNWRWACVVLLVDQWCWTAEIKKRFSYLLVHLGVQEGLGGLVYQRGPLIETKRGVRNPFGNDIKQTFTSLKVFFGIHLKCCTFVSRSCDTSNLFIPDRFMLLAVSWVQMCEGVNKRVEGQTGLTHLSSWGSGRTG